jgi:ribosomal protein S14
VTYYLTLPCRGCGAPITVNLYMMPRLLLCDACFRHSVSAGVVFGVAAALRGY